MRLGIARVATARLSDATGVITGPIMDSRLQSETAFNVNDRNPFDCRAIHATFHRRVGREQTVGTHSMRGIETEMGPASAGPISLSEKRCRTRAFNVADFVLGLVQLFDQGDGKHFYVPIPSLWFGGDSGSIVVFPCSVNRGIRSPRALSSYLDRMQRPGNRNKTLVEELHLLIKCNDMLIVNSNFEAALPDADGRRGISVCCRWVVTPLRAATRTRRTVPGWTPDPTDQK